MSYKLLGFNTSKGRIEFAVLHNIQAKNESELHSYVKRVKPKFHYETLGVVDMNGRLVFKL